MLEVHVWSLCSALMLGVHVLRSCSAFMFCTTLWVHVFITCFAFISFHRLSFCIHCLSCSLHVAFISLHFAFIAFPFVFMSFHIPSLCVKHTGLQKLICSNRSGVYLPKRSGFLICRYRFCYRLAIVLGACVGCHLQVSWACPCISTLSFFFSYRFLGRQCVGSVKLQNKLKWNARGYYTIPN